MEDTKTVIGYIDALKALLEGAAIDHEISKDEQYIRLKTELQGISRIVPFLPDFLKSRPTLSSFRTFTQQENKRPNAPHSSYAERRALIQDAFKVTLEYLYDELRNPMAAPLTHSLTAVDSPHVAMACRKAMDRVYIDPDGAITSARSLLETVFKHILDEQGTSYQKAADLPDLYKAAARAMNLAPDQQSESDMRQMLQGCLSVVQGMGALRNRIGDAHGKDALAGKVEKHHAVLVVGIACSVASFMIDSWIKRSATSA